MRQQNSQMVAKYGVMIALAMVLSYVEAQIPLFYAFYGMKLGLANVVTLFALYLMDIKSALLINMIRILLVSILFGTALSLAYSLAGGLLSGIVMALLKKSGKFHMVTVSVAGGIFHNIGQILVAMAVFETASLAWYVVILWFTGIGAGVVIGLIGSVLCKRLQGFFNSVSH